MIRSEYRIVPLSARKPLLGLRVRAHQSECHQFSTHVKELQITIGVTANDVIGYLVVSSANVG